jgi:hypothetical protein
MYARKRKSRGPDPVQTILQWINWQDLDGEFDAWLETIPPTITRIDYLPFVTAHNAPDHIITAAHTVMDPVIRW